MKNNLNNIMFTYKLKGEDEGQKLEQLLFRKFHFSRKQLQKIKIGENAWLDGHFVYLNTRGGAGQTLQVNLLEEEYATIAGEEIPLDILYEDDLFLAVNKPAGQIVHPNPQYPIGTLGNAVLGYWQRKQESRVFRPIFRLDRNTSGIVLIAKTRYAHQQIARQAEMKLVDKKYLGLVQGDILANQGEFAFPISLQPGSKIIREVCQDGKPALTYFRVLKRHSNYTWAEFTLITGRTHQIRVHCQAAGHPLLGDDLYGGNTALLSRQALHCHHYAFNHPLTNTRIKIQSALPQDLLSIFPLSKKLYS